LWGCTAADAVCNVAAVPRPRTALNHVRCHPCCDRLEDELRELQQLCISQSERLVHLIACKGYSTHSRAQDVLPVPDSDSQPPPLNNHPAPAAGDGPANNLPLPHTASAPRCSPETPPSCPASSASLSAGTGAASHGPDTSRSVPHSYASWLLAMEDFKLDPDSLPDDITALNAMLQQDRPGAAQPQDPLLPTAGPVAEAREAGNLDSISAIGSSEPSHSSNVGGTSILEGLDRKLDRKLASKKCRRAPSVLTSMKG
jgi:hypothetical protein